MRLFTLLLSLLVALPVFSAWQLDSNSSFVSFTSVKKTDITENHRFTAVAGNITEQGQLDIVIDLNSVDTKIAIRDERMKKFLFETGLYPNAQFLAQIDNEALASLIQGSSQLMTVQGDINLHGQKQPASVDVLVSKLSENKIVVASTQSLLIRASDYKLLNGINKLKELAKLPTIGATVPVNFVLTFSQD